MRLALALIVVGCARHAAAPPPPQDKLPEVSVMLDPPPTGAKIVIDGVHDVTAPATRSQTLEPTLLAVAPDVTYATLVDTVQTLRRPPYLLLVRTPKGIGSVPLPLPKAMAGSIEDEPTLVLTIARSSDGKPQLFVGASQVAQSDLERSLRDSHPHRIALAIDKATSVADLANILATAQHVAPDAAVLVPPQPTPPVPASP